MSSDDCDKKRNTYRLKNPKNTNLRFFAYDVFKPGEIAFSRISDFVKDCEYSSVDYSLNTMNSVPFLVKSFGKNYRTHGCFIKFNNNDSYDAYKIISEAKSKKLYRWDTISIYNEKINVLFAKEDVIKFKYAENKGYYESMSDPMFVDCLKIICDNLIQILNEGSFHTNFFNLQMNYMLLWSSIDRYIVFRYGKRNQQDNLVCLANEDIFKKAVFKFSDMKNENPKVFSNEDYRSFELDKTKPLCCIRYYYTIRCNVVHTGKASFDDYKLLKKSLFELLLIYMYVLSYVLDEKNLFKNEFQKMKELLIGKNVF